MDVVSVLDLPHSEARAAVAAEGAVVFVGVNPVEFHGPHLSLHNDAWISLGLAKDLARALGHERLLWAGELEMGVEPCPGPGSRHVATAVVAAAVDDACLRLFELGCRKIVVMTFHGAPLHSWALHKGTARFRARGGRAIQPLTLVFDALFHLDTSAMGGAVRGAPDDVKQALLDGIATDFHAGFFETSLTLHYAPQTVATTTMRALPPCPPLVPERLFVKLAALARALGNDDLAGEFVLAGHGRAWNALRPFPGYTGQPRYANAEAGAFFAGVIVDAYRDVVRSVVDDGEDPPRPIMPWLYALTLGGRLPTGHIAVEDVRVGP